MTERHESAIQVLPDSYVESGTGRKETWSATKTWRDTKQTQELTRDRDEGTEWNDWLKKRNHPRYSSCKDRMKIMMAGILQSYTWVTSFSCLLFNRMSHWMPVQKLSHLLSLFFSLLLLVPSSSSLFFSHSLFFPTTTFLEEDMFVSWFSNIIFPVKDFSSPRDKMWAEFAPDSFSPGIRIFVHVILYSYT